MADVGTGTTVAFATTGFASKVTDVKLNDISRAEVDITHLASTVKESMPGDLVDWGSLDLEILFDPDDWPPVDQAPENVTLTFPVPAGLSNGATMVGEGYISKMVGAVPLEEKMSATITLKWTGAVTITPAS